MSGSDSSWLVEFEVKAKIDRTLTHDEQLKRAIDACELDESTGTPDYCSFQMWFSVRSSTCQHDSLPLDVRDGPSSSIRHAWLRRLMERHVEMTLRADEVLSSKSGGRRWRELKLLRSLIAPDDDRMEKVLSGAVELARDLGAKAETLVGKSAAAIRARFFAAIATKDQELAVRCLGALATHESDHDDGEIDYLNALCALNAQQYEAAESYAKRVSPGDRDFAKAQRIVLEANAWQGNTKAVSALLASEVAIQLSSCEKLLLAHATLLGSKEPNATFEEVINWVGVVSISPEDVAYNRYAKSHVRAMVELHEALVDLELKRRAQNSSSPCPTDAPTRVLQLAAAVGLISDSLKSVLEDGAASWASSVLQPDDQFRGYDYWEFQLNQLTRLGAYDAVMENINSALPSIDRLPEETQTAVALLGVFVAERTAHQSLGGWVALAKKLAGHSDVDATLADARVRRRLEGLQPMSQLSYREALKQLQALQAKNSSWLDCGMISLGFFRVLELELNKHLVAPLRRVALPAPSELERKVWQPFQRKANGFELGPLRTFVSGCIEFSGEPRAAQALEIWRSMMTEAGRTALNRCVGGSESVWTVLEWISTEACRKYRNPPAHTEFLDLDTAAACREHVDKALDDLSLVFLRAAQ
jgi:hypothetical protein